MLKISLTTPTATRLGSALLALAIALPGSAATPTTATPAASTLMTLYNFNDLNDGGFPEAGVVQDSSGALYGVSSSGSTGWGSVFQLTPGTGGTWTESTLYTFTGGADGATPLGALLIGANGILYGTTYDGGAHGYGTVFQLAPGTGSSWTLTTLYSFLGGTDGANPSAGLVLGASTGTLYGTTFNGGTKGMGAVFELNPVKTGGYTEKLLYSFQGGADGANPMASLALSSKTVLYGTTSQGGSVTITNQPPTCTTSTPCVYANQGTVFQVAPAGGGVWKESLLYTFTGQGDGGSPESPLILSSLGVLYGNTFWGGTALNCPESAYAQGCGVVFQLAPPTGTVTTWTQKVLYNFTGVSPDGAHPYGPMSINANTDLFGTTFSGGGTQDLCFPEAYIGCGTIFELKPGKSGVWTKSNISSFPGSPAGGSPNGILLGANGVLYGTTIVGGNSGGYGTVFAFGPSN